MSPTLILQNIRDMSPCLHVSPHVPRGPRRCVPRRRRRPETLGPHGRGLRRHLQRQSQGYRHITRRQHLCGDVRRRGGALVVVTGGVVITRTGSVHPVRRRLRTRTVVTPSQTTLSLTPSDPDCVLPESPRTAGLGGTHGGAPRPVHERRGRVRFHAGVSPAFPVRPGSDKGRGHSDGPRP